MRIPHIKSVKLNAASVFWIVLLLALVLDVLAVKRGYGILGLARTQDLGILSTRSVRVNFESYNTAVKRVEDAIVFQPKFVDDRNPFQLVPNANE